MADSMTSPPSSSVPSSGGAELDALIREGGAEGTFDLDALNERPLELGEKADDAVDFEDIGDDDLAEDEMDTEDIGGAVQPPLGQQSQEDAFLEGIFDEAKPEAEDEDIDMDDLFGDAGDDEQVEAAPGVDGTPALPESEPLQNGIKKTVPEKSFSELYGEDDDELIAEESPAAGGQGLAGLEELDLDEEQNKEYMLQQALFAQTGIQLDLPDNQQDNDAELLRLIAPKYKQDEVPRWHEIFPPRRLNFDHKTPARPPKPIRPTKANLEIEQDQKMLFNSGIGQGNRSGDPEANGLISTENATGKAAVSEEEDNGLEPDTDGLLPGGITEQDLQILCADWDTLTRSDGSEEVHDIVVRDVDDDDDPFSDDFDSAYQCPAKKRKTGPNPHDIVSTYLYDIPSFDDPERMLSRIARKVVLDLNDPHLLLEKIDPAQVAKTQNTTEKDSKKTIKEKLAARFNHGNDAEYDMLKQNHQNKIRSTLGNLSVDHSAPAVKLQYPYYKVRLSTEEARAFHRHQAVFKPVLPVVFTKPTRQKRKHMKGKKINEVFVSTKDLTLSDNSTALLLEYSEEYPMMMSQVGMGSRIINYYRKRNKDDGYRPKGDIGETAVLLPEDKSPFHIFGHIDSGETVMAVYNSMYRAPVFEHQGRDRDFLLVRTTTGLSGQEWFLRKANHLCAVGQQFPSVDVPGPHSRKVTTASKNRLKMISYRIMRRRKNHRLRVEDVTRHFPDTTDMQNRQKMKEFLSFNRDYKEWEMKSSEQIPDEDVLRGYVRPEDVCLLESMQVGQQYLHDAGIQDDNDEDDDAKEGQNLEQQLAPWHTSRNFINATQGKAMLQLHGDGDPSGRGEAFSFIRTSMKGGFKALGESVTDKMATMKELGGHSYNVARQQKAYEDSIRRIWEAQKASLSSAMDHSSDADMDDAQEEEAAAATGLSRPTPRSEALTPAPWDETRSQITSVSNASQSGNSVLRIRRTVKRNGQLEEVEEVIKDPAIIRQYKRRKMQEEAAKVALSDLKPTGDSEYDARTRKRLEDELARLEKNRERRVAREKAKGKHGGAGDAGSPEAADSPATGPGVGTGKVAGTQRKCANCGQVGHIKTNKKLCPLLNGTMKQENAFNDPAAFMGAPPTL